MLAEESTPLPCGPPVIQDRSLTLTIARLTVLASRSLVVAVCPVTSFILRGVGTRTLTAVHFIVGVWASIDVTFSGQNNPPAHNRYERWLDRWLHPGNSCP